MARKNSKTAPIQFLAAAVTAVAQHKLANTAPAPQGGPLLAVTAAGLATAQRQGLATVQRSASGQGMQWRATGIKAPNLRAQALAAILALANGGPVTQQAALAALAGVPLGSKTPASRISAFIRAGLLAHTA